MLFLSSFARGVSEKQNKCSFVLFFPTLSAPPSQDCEGRGGVLKGVFDVI